MSCSGSAVNEERSYEHFCRIDYTPVKEGTLLLTLPDGKVIKDLGGVLYVSVIDEVSSVWGRIDYETGNVERVISTAEYNYDVEAANGRGDS